MPYAEIVHQDPETKEKSIFFVYRDKVEKVLQNFALQIDHSCHEVDLETFGELTSGKTYGSVGRLSREEVYAFREAAKNHDIRFSITSDGPLYGWWPMMGEGFRMCWRICPIICPGSGGMPIRPIWRITLGSWRNLTGGWSRGSRMYYIWWMPKTPGILSLRTVRALLLIPWGAGKRSCRMAAQGLCCMTQGL